MQQRNALIVVDVRNDFCEGGALPVVGGALVAQHVAGYLAHHRADYALVVATRDWHRPGSDNGGHFAAPGQQPDFENTWPVHCVQNTHGADYRPEVQQMLPAVDVEIVKGDGRPAYSGFEGVTPGEGRLLRDVLTDHAITAVDVVGLATDYCVCATAEDAQAAGFTTSVLEDLCAGVAERTTHDKEREMHADHVHLRTSDVSSASRR